MSGETVELTIEEMAVASESEFTGDVWELTVETGLRGPPGIGGEELVHGDLPGRDSVNQHPDTAISVAANTLGAWDPDTLEAALTVLYEGFGIDQDTIDTYVAGLAAIVTVQPNDVHQALINGATVAAAQSALSAYQTGILTTTITATALVADLQAEAHAHATVYADTADYFDLCGRSGADLHDDWAWKNGPAGEFSTGYWWRGLIFVEPFYRDGAYDGELVFSEIDTQTHDSEVGSWDNRERAIVRIWSDADSRWRNYAYFECTLEGGSEEVIRVFTNNASPTGTYAYNVDLYTGWEIPESQWVELACHLDFTGGPAGVWRHRELVRAVATEPDVILDGIGWRIHYNAHGDVAGSIDTGVTEPWTFGLDKGAVRMAWMVVGDGPAGTVYANPTATGALAADPAGVSAFTDGVGETWTPEVDAIARTTTTTTTVTTSDITGVATARILGRTTAGTGTAEELTASAVRTLLSLVVGTDVQAYDAELAALAGLVSAANKLAYFTGSGTAALTDLSSFIRTLLDDADAVTARTTLGAASLSAVPFKAAVGDWVSNPHDSIYAATQTLNRVAYVPYLVPAGFTQTDGIAVEVTTVATSALCRLGIYLPHATTGRPDALVIDGGTVDFSSGGGAAGVRTLTITATNLTPGSLIYIAVVPQGATAAARHCNTGEILRSYGFASSTVTDVFRANGAAGYYENSVSGSLPANATVTIGSITGQPVVALRRS